MLDQPASANALWDLYARGGPRPEFVIAVLSYESHLNPAADNGVGYYGIGQNVASFIEAHAGTDPDTYKSWPASEQLSRVVTPYFLGQVANYGPLTSGVRTYQAEFYPASLKYALALDDVIVEEPSSAYEDNKVFDKDGKGSITPQDLANTLTTQANQTYVKSAIAATYAEAPSGVGGPQDPVYGGGGSPGGHSKKTKTVALLAVLGAAGVYFWETGELERLLFDARRGIRNHLGHR